MRFTPIEIYQKEFEKGMHLRGYDPEQVDAFIEVVAGEYEALFKELNRLQEENEELKEELEKYKKMEDKLNNTLYVAQKTLEDKREQAENEARTIIREAETRAREILVKAREELQAKRKEYEKLCEIEELFRVRFKNLLRSQMELLEKGRPGREDQSEKTIKMERPETAEEGA